MRSNDVTRILSRFCCFIHCKHVSHSQFKHRLKQYSFHAAQYSTETNSEHWLKSYLKENQYEGSIRLPRKKHDIFQNFSVCGGKYRACLVTPKTRPQVQQFMLENFYSLAPVPSVLGLYSGKVTPYLEDELSLFLDQNLSFGLYHEDRIVAAGFNLLFEHGLEEEEEEEEMVRAVDWHNTAAEIAMEEGEEDVVAKWRNSQFLHLQYVGQKTAARYKTPFCLHFSCLATHSDYRGKDHMTTRLLDKLIRQVWSKGGVVTTVSNLPFFEASLLKTYKNEVSILDRVPYTSLQLTLSGKPVFHSLESLNSITYLSLYPQSVNSVTHP